ncbi:MAG TPA: RES family NAD+ phosphorylase, partial [Candidatus Tumulicola sp.]|nr:RES family NAD+ phosphorylase [Candidatus Tumulicola sp.]
VPSSVQTVGDEWITSGRSLALRVPSVIVDGGFNILINPEHAHFGRLTVDSISVYDFDPRLLR